MKVVVPPAPAGVLQNKNASQKPPTAREKFGLTQAFDAGFIGRTLVSMLGVGALGMLGILGASQSPQAASSFFGGILMGVVLLKSQELFVQKVLGPRGTGENNLLVSRLPLAVVLPMKYLFIGALLWTCIEQGWLHPVALAAGFIAAQIVIVAKVVGRFAALKLRASQK